MKISLSTLIYSVVRESFVIRCYSCERDKENKMPWYICSWHTNEREKQKEHGYLFWLKAKI